MTTATPTTQNKFEKLKSEKDGLAVKAELEEFARIGWEAMDENDREHRLKWLGVFFRPVDRKSTRLNSSHRNTSRMPSSA